MSSAGQMPDRVQEVLAAFVNLKLGASLERAHEALVQWRAGDCGPFEAHAEILAHVARADTLAAAVSTTGKERTAQLLRAAFDAGLLAEDELRALTGKRPEELVPPDDLDAEPSLAGQLPAKIDVVNRLLGEGAISLHIDARREGVSVPARLKDDPRLVLRFGYDLKPAIVDLLVDEEGVSGTLHFSGQLHHCMLPWGAIYAAVSESAERGMVWPDDVPREAIAELEAAAEAEPPAPPPPAKPARSRGHLRLVD